MLPREFLSVYGRPVVRTRVLAAGEEMVIEPDPERYLLAFWSMSAGVLVHPDSSADAGTLGFGPALYETQLIYTHALHGALVNLGFRLTNAGMPFTVTWVVGRMLPPTPTKMRQRNVKAKH